MLKGLWEYLFNKLILLNNKYFRCHLRKMAVLNSQVFSKLSLSKPSLCLPLHLVKVNDHATSELLILQNMESCGRKIGIH